MIKFKPDKDPYYTGRSNAMRAQAAVAPVNAGCVARGEAPLVDRDSVLALLVDLGHLCDQKALDYDDLTAWARMHWQEER